MQKFWLFIFLGLFLAFSSPLSAQESGGKVILDLKEDEEPKEHLNLGHLKQYITDVEEYDIKYPGDKINEDFIDDIRASYPDYTFDGAAIRESLVRKGVKGYRIYKHLKSKFQKFMLENEIPLWVSDEDYEDGTMPEYQPTDKPLIIKDFKKVISYSVSKRDQAAAKEKEAERAGEMPYSEKLRIMKQAIIKGDWKTVFSYGLFDGKPIEDKRGIGQWYGKPQQLRARIVSAFKTTGKQEKITGALQLYIPQGEFLLSKHFRDNKSIKIDYSNSENIKNLYFNWPIPYRLPLGQGDDLNGYIGSVVIPFDLEVKDVLKPILLKINISASLCNSIRCQPESVKTELELDIGDEIQNSSMASFLDLIRHGLPQTKHDDLQLLHLVVEENPSGGQILRLEAKVSEEPASFNVFIEGKEQDEFAAPRIRIDGSKVIARFQALDKNVDYADKSITFVAATPSDVSVRQTLKAEKTSQFDSETNNLTLKLILFALLGGFLLNFMPSVLPIILLRFVSLCKFGSKNYKQIISEIRFNILGIVLSFVGLIIILLVIKFYYHSITWGIQFQNKALIVLTMFLMGWTLAYIWNFVSLRSPSEDYKLKSVIYGIGMVFLAVLFPSPYLSTALSFAFDSGVLDTIILMSFVCLGISLPYIIILMFPDFLALLPHPGKWTRVVYFLNTCLLIIALFWLMLLLSLQTSGNIFWHFIVILLCFWFVLLLRKLFLQSLTEQEDDPKIFKKISLLFNSVSFVLILTLLSVSFYDVYTYDDTSKEQNVENNQIDMKIINNEIRQGRSVLVKVTADWCLSCRYNDLIVFNAESIKEMFSDAEIMVLEINYDYQDKSVLDLMKTFGRRDIPFYVIFTPRIPEGIVLPKIMSDAGIRKIIDNLRY